MHLYDLLSKPVIFGHRGASQAAPENTLASFDLAIRQGVKAFELDTMLTLDNQPVVIHDQTLERTTNGQGEVSQHSLAEIRALDAGSYFAKEFQGEKVPLLGEVLERYPTAILINIELKNYHQPQDGLARIVLDLVERLHMLDNVIFSSFLPSNLKIIREANREACTALLTPAGWAGFLARSRLFMDCSPDMVHPNFRDVSAAYIKREHRRGRRVNAWTINQPDVARDLIRWGVDGLMGDDPVSLLELLA